MKTASVNELKNELALLGQKEVVELCLRLARFKKENKELLTYLIYESHDLDSYLNEVKREMDKQFEGMNRSNLYLTKKSLRAILRSNNKFTRYTGTKKAEIEILTYFISCIARHNIPVHDSVKLANLYSTQLEKIRKVIAEQEDDLQYDYQLELKKWVIEK
ncbi:MAG TPA: hypothetical protein VL651_15235 [Bacteroidia bacterium]|jgi:hypothetical protein|nr:hypothetical protein [Bacteroidia bacterium]